MRCSAETSDEWYDPPCRHHHGRQRPLGGAARSAPYRRSPAGAKQVSEVLEAANECGVEFLTLYAFSTENWKRPPAEIAALMNLLEGVHRPEPAGAAEARGPAAHHRSDRRTPRRRAARNCSPPSKRRRTTRRARSISRSTTAAAPRSSTRSTGSPPNWRGSRAGRSPRRASATTSTRRYSGSGSADPDQRRASAEQLPALGALLRPNCMSPTPSGRDFGKEEFKAAVAAFQQRDRRFGGRK